MQLIGQFDSPFVRGVDRFASEAYAHLVSLTDYPALAEHTARAEARKEFRAISQPFIPPA
jgi:hypothetical protein